MNKRDAINEIVKCAEIYHRNLENRNLLFIFGNKENPSYFESIFYKTNFLHLTGIVLNKSNTVGNTQLNNPIFYHNALDNKLAADDFSFKSDGTTEIKLQVLSSILNLPYTARMVGNFNAPAPKLFTHKLAGNISACIGFRKLNDSKYYVPNTTLKGDMRDIVQSQRRVLLVMRKSTKDHTYTEICRIAKGLTLDDIKLPDELKDLISLK